MTNPEEGHFKASLLTLINGQQYLQTKAVIEHDAKHNM